MIKSFGKTALIPLTVISSVFVYHTVITNKNIRFNNNDDNDDNDDNNPNNTLCVVKKPYYIYNQYRNIIIFFKKTKKTIFGMNNSTKFKLYINVMNSIENSTIYIPFFMLSSMIMYGAVKSKRNNKNNTDININDLNEKNTDINVNDLNEKNTDINVNDLNKNNATTNNLKETNTDINKLQCVDEGFFEKIKKTFLRTSSLNYTENTRPIDPNNEDYFVHTISSSVKNNSINNNVQIRINEDRTIVNNYELIDSTLNFVDLNEKMVDMLFGNMTAKNIKTKKNNIVEISSEINFKTSLEILLKNEVLCTPVFKISNNIKEYIGILNVGHIVSSCINKKNLLSSIDNENCLNTITCVKEYSPISNIIYKMKNNIRHIVIFNNENLITKIISHGALFNHIHKNILNNNSIILDEETKHILSCKLSEFDVIKNRKPKYISDPNMLIIKAFKYITINHLSSIALISKKNIIENVVSLSDVKSLSNHPECELSTMTVNEFINLANTDKNIKREIITGNMNDNIEQVINKLVHNKIHQLYIVDNNNKFINYISYTDILHILF
jgi:CBS-domain-containing membrane protein